MRKLHTVWPLAIFMLVVTIQFSACSKRAEPANQPAKPTESKDRTYRTLNGESVIAIISSDELEIRNNKNNLVCKYTEKDGKLRIVMTELGTTTAKYYNITPDGLVGEVGDILYGPGAYETHLKAEQAASSGNEAWGSGDRRKAVAFYTEAIRLTARDPNAHNRRGNAFYLLGDYDKALDDFNETLRIAPKFNITLTRRGSTFAKLGQYDKALSDYEEAISLDPNYAHSYNGCAWLLAVCPDADFRNGKKAVEYAEKACQLHSDGSRWMFLDTLAAAHAEAGDFDKAVEFARLIVNMGIPADKLASAKERLSLYENRMPYHEARNGNERMSGPAARVTR